MFIDRLMQKIQSTDNPTVVGLDPRIEYVPKYIYEESKLKFENPLQVCAEAILQFNQGLIDELFDIIPVIKPQLAYYEMYGVYGMDAFHRTIEYAKKKGLLVLADGKRNDIGSTAEAYATAYIGETKMPDGMYIPAFSVDAITVNPYLGMDGILPFIDQCKRFDKGIFVLVKTSNPSSQEIQDLRLDNGKYLYEYMAELVSQWGEELIGKQGFSSVGAVVGATHPEQAKQIRKIAKQTFLLVPGYGAQGATAKDISYCFDRNGLGAIVNASRSIMCAYMSETWKNQFTQKEYAKAARAEALKMKEDILAVL